MVSPVDELRTAIWRLDSGSSSSDYTPWMRIVDMRNQYTWSTWKGEEHSEVVDIKKVLLDVNWPWMSVHGFLGLP